MVQKGGGSLRYHSIQFPNGMIITGHSRCCAALRHFTTGIIPLGSPLLTLSAQLSIGLYKHSTGIIPTINPPLCYSIMVYRLLFLLIYTLIILIFGSVLLCEGAENLPTIMEFDNLHITENLKLAKDDEFEVVNEFLYRQLVG